MNNRGIGAAVLALAVIFTCIGSIGGIVLHYALHQCPEAEGDQTPPLRPGMWVLIDSADGPQRHQVAELSPPYVRLTGSGDHEHWAHRSQVVAIASPPSRPRRPSRPSGSQTGSPSGSRTGSGPDVGALE